MQLPEGQAARAAAELKPAAPELAAQMRAGEISLADAIREVRRAEVIERLESTDARQAKELAGLYDVIPIRDRAG